MIRATETAKRCLRPAFLTCSFRQLGPAILVVLLASLTVNAGYTEPLPFLTPLSPEATLALKSQNGDTPAIIDFANDYGAPVVLYWVNYTGQLVFYAVLEPEAVRIQYTFLTHPWIVYDQATGLPIEGFLPIAQEAAALITKPAINDGQKRQCAVSQADNLHSAQETLQAAQRTSGKLSGSFIMLAMTYEFLAVSDGKCAVDPPDPDFKVIAVPSISIPTAIKPGGNVNSAEARAFNALISNIATSTGVLNAAITSANRALGAADAGSQKWQRLQTKAAQQYIMMVEKLAKEEAALATQLCKALEAAGVDGGC